MASKIEIVIVEKRNINYECFLHELFREIKESRILYIILYILHDASSIYDAPSSSSFEITEPLHQQPTNNAITHPKKAEYLAFKLDRSREKEGRYVSHKLFLSRCISENVIPNGLRLEPEPTI